jgi:serine protease SohB
MCASGGYYIASACDEIHVIPSSVVGSIGVQALNIGVVELFKKWGLEDRTMTAGTSKNSDSPFKPRDPVAVQKTARMLEEIHQDFKIKVAAGRGERLRHGDAAAYARQVGDYKSRSERREALFDGSVFLGRKAVEFGLADGLYEDMVASLQERFGEDVRLLELKTKQGLFERLQDMQAARAAEHAAALARAARAELANRL